MDGYLTLWMLAEHRVEADHAVHFGHRHAQRRRDLARRRGGDVPERRLDIPQGGQQRIALPSGVPPQDRVQ